MNTFTQIFRLSGHSLVRKEGVADRDVPLDGDGQRRVDGAGESDVRQRQHERQHVDAGETKGQNFAAWNIAKKSVAN